jgi:hypothetical protein
MVGGAALLHYYFGGRIERAEEMRRLARKELDAAGTDPLPKLAYLHSEALLTLQNGAFTSCGRAVEEGLSLANASGIHVWSGSLLMLGILSAVARGELDAAERYLDALGANPHAPTFARGQYAFGRACVAFERGDLEAAIRWNRDSLEHTQRAGFKFARCSNAIAEVAYHATAADRVELDEALGRLDECLRDAYCPFLAASAAVARAYAGLCMGEDGVELLRAGLARARAGAIMCPGFLGRRAIARLVTAALAHDVEVEFARTLLRAHDIRPGPEALTLANWPWPVKVRTLGPLSVEVDGAPVCFGRKTPTVPLALLKLLAASTEPLTAASLRSALWPGYPGEAHRGTLDTALYRLRKLIGVEAAIESDSSGVALSASTCWTDTRAFAVCCDRIGRLLGTAEAPTMAAVSESEHTLLELYRGPFGADDDPPALLRAREQLRRRFARAVTDLDRLWLRLGERERRQRLAALAQSRNEGASILETA